MAGGEGTRLRPLTCGLPKPMVPILNKPIMEHIINLLKENGIEDIAVTMAYLPEVIRDYFGDGSQWGVNFTYYIEDTPLGTGGSVKNAQEFLDETFIVISGDALTDINLPKVIEFHKEKKSMATLVLKKEFIPLEYGVIITDQRDRIIRFLEKPSWGEVFSDTINTGIYILEPEIMDYYKKGERFDFSKDLFPKILQDRLPMYGYVAKDYWCDIGDIATYNQSQFDTLQGLVNLPKIYQQYKEIEKGIWVGEGVEYKENVKFIPPVCMGKNSYIEKESSIGPNVVMGENCHVGQGTSIKNSIIWGNCSMGSQVELRGSIICQGSSLGDRSNLYEQSVVGNQVRVLPGATINPNIKIWPHKIIEENTVVDQHLIWGTKASKILFGHRGISGELNVDITPEFASQLGSALATTLKEKGKVILASDQNKGSQLIKQAITSGILAGGLGVIDVGEGPLPLLRYAIRYFKSPGGVYISGEELQSSKLHIEIMNEKGANVDRNTEKNIENIFNRGDFQRVNNKQMSRVLYQKDFSTAYITQGISLLNSIDKVKERNMNVIVSSPENSILALGSTLLETLGCHVYRIKVDEKEKNHQTIFSHIESQIKKGQGDLGIFIDKKGESLVLFDEEGEKIQKERYQLLADLIALKTGNCKKVVASHTFPEAIEDIAKKYHAEVVRTKSAPSEVLNEILTIEEDNEQLLPYILRYDALWAMGKIIDYLVQENISLRELITEIPEFYYKEEHIPCNWKDKGRVIGKIISQYDEEVLELFEGVKIKEDKGWAIVLPDSEKPLVNIYTQGFSEEYAQELSNDFIEKVKKIIDGEK